MKPTREEVIRVARELELLPDNSYPSTRTRYMKQKQEQIERLAQHFYEAGAAAAREPLTDSSDALWEALGRWCAELTNNDITKIVPPKYLVDAVRVATSRTDAKATGEKL